jgi:hypothetical protein
MIFLSLQSDNNDIKNIVLYINNIWKDLKKK